MAFVLFLFVISSAFAQENHTCFPSCEPLQCTGLFGPREGSQERWTTTAEWMKARVPSIHIDDRIVMAPGRFGDQVTITADFVKKGEILLKMPVASFLLEEDCFPTEAFGALGINYTSSLKKKPAYTWNASKTNGADFTQVALCLLVHRLLGNESAYAGYIRQLPQQSSSETYMFRPLTDMDSLKGTDAYRIASVVKRRHLNALETAANGEPFKTIQSYFPHLNWTIDEFKREFQQTLSLCGSRTFNLDSEMLMPGKVHTKLYRPALVPLLDMLNHGDLRTRNCQYWFNTTGQYFQLQAIRDIPAGEELIQSYGARSNAELQLFYGFHMPGNIEDFLSVADLTQGATEYNFHHRLGHSSRCHTPYFRPVDGSAWPPQLEVIIKEGSPDENASVLNLGPLSPSVYYGFAQKLKQQPLPDNVVKAFTSLARHKDAELKIVEGEFVVSYDNTSTIEEQNKTSNGTKRGDLTVTLLWTPITHHSSCQKIIRPLCEDYAPGINSVTTIVQRLSQGLIPQIARAGGCMLYSKSRQTTYEIKLTAEGAWAGVVAEDPLPEPGVVPTVSETSPHEADLFREFQFKRYVLRTMGVEQFATKVFRNGLMPETLTSIRIAVLPELSSYAIHSVFSGIRLDPQLEEQVAKTLMMFCFEELTRRLQVLGVETAQESFDFLLDQAQAMSQTHAEGSYEKLARHDLGIAHDFCTGLTGWGLPLWDRV